MVFTINAAEEAIISNAALLSMRPIVSRRAEIERLVGSFRDSKKFCTGYHLCWRGHLGAERIRTSLEHADSGLTVENGTVKLAGTLTVHGCRRNPRRICGRLYHSR